MSFIVNARLPGLQRKPLSIKESREKKTEPQTIEQNSEYDRVV